MNAFEHFIHSILTFEHLLLVQRADVLEASPELRRLAREELMLVYFFGARD
jgi:hypothetical protein